MHGTSAPNKDLQVPYLRSQCPFRLRIRDWDREVPKTHFMASQSSFSIPNCLSGSVPTLGGRSLDSGTSKIWLVPKVCLSSRAILATPLCFDMLTMVPVDWATPSPITTMPVPILRVSLKPPSAAKHAFARLANERHGLGVGGTRNLSTHWWTVRQYPSRDGRERETD